MQAGASWLAAVALFGALAVGASANPVTDSNDASLGLPALTLQDEQTLEARVALGRKLFMDRRLSRNGTMSCGMCHIPEQGFAAVELATAVGIEGRSLRRNAPTVLNVGYNVFLFHDGRETRLEDQVWGPLLAADEMGNGTREAVVERIARLADYAGLFEEAFAEQGLAPETIARALADYERALASGGSRFDRWYFGGERNALTAEEQRGFELFSGQARCGLCHTIESDYALFTDQRFHNTGVGWRAAKQAPGEVRVPLAPGVETQMSTSLIARLFGGNPLDEGRYEITQREDDRFAYRTPGLRNVALTAPYMHDGSLPTLDVVVQFYKRGGIDNPGKDSLLMPLELSAEDEQALVAFLRSLTGANVDRLAAEARAAALRSALR